MTVFISFLVAILLIFLVERTSNRKASGEGHIRPHVFYFATGVLCIIFDLMIIFLPHSTSGNDTIVFYTLIIVFAIAGIFCVYTYFGCSILIEPNSVLIASLFRKKARLAVEDIIQLKEIGFFRVLMIEGRNTGKYYFPCDAYNLEKFLTMMQREHPEVFSARR